MRDWGLLLKMETVRINGTLFNIQDSFSINFNNFETLNNAEIKLELNDKIEFAYFDEIIIDKYYFCLVASLVQRM